jgi:hypothetical protein
VRASERRTAAVQLRPLYWAVFGGSGNRPLFYVRPARAHSCGCKSRRKLITANEVKRNCRRVTDCRKEARSVSRESMDKNRIEGAAEQGERA